MFRHEKSEFWTRQWLDQVLCKNEKETCADRARGGESRGVPGEGGCGLGEGRLRVEKKARAMSGAGGGEGERWRPAAMQADGCSSSMVGSKGNGASP